MSSHPLHLAVAEKLAAQRLPIQFELLRDPACGGNQHLPLFIGTKKSRAARMCCVDLLILADNKVRGIIEIEESGFLPTKICGKFLQAALATHFIHQSHKKEGPIPYTEKVLFIQVLDGSKCLKSGTRKDAQAKLVERRIQQMLPLGTVTDYALFFVSGAQDESGLDAVSSCMMRAAGDA